MTWRVGIDVGGTFTDLYAFNRVTGEARTSKVLTTTEERARGVLDSIRAANLAVHDIELLLHGTTTVTNALLERKFEDAAMLTTAGFRDTIEIGRQLRQYQYRPYQTKPKPYIRRRYRFTVDERIDSDGEIVRPLDESAVIQVARNIKQKGIRAVAVCFINSYANGANETRAAEVLRTECPELLIALSHETVPTFREHARFSTTAIRAVAMPIISAYFEALERTLETAGFHGRLMILKSNGGVAGVRLAADHPEQLVESGPAGGVSYAAELGRQTGFRKILHTDMGGTSFDASIIEDGEGLTTRTHELEFQTPVCVPMLEIRSVGAGGGSIAWIDEGGSLRVGPESAGSDPGPACYGRGGKRPTITDANAVLGRLDPSLGGKLALDVGAARTALRPLADRLAMTIEDLAEGMIQICTEHMADAVKMVLLERGRDQRDFVLASFGGAGAMHACMVARAMNMSIVVVPAFAGVASAYGATVMNLRHDVEGFFYSPVRDVCLGALNQKLNEIEGTARRLLRADLPDATDISIRRTAQMRYVGQSNEIENMIPNGDVRDPTLGAVSQEFHRVHEREYGVSSAELEPAFVSLGVSASASLQGPMDPPVSFERPHTSVAQTSDRKVYFEGRWTDTRIYTAESFPEDTKFEGPAIISYPHACCVLPADTSAVTDRFGNLIVRLGDTQVSKSAMEHRQ